MSDKDEIQHLDRAGVKISVSDAVVCCLRGSAAVRDVRDGVECRAELQHRRAASAVGDKAFVSADALGSDEGGRAR